ncbi:hypothetical protein ACIOG8_19175 [Streptomyces erythrochromogenes]
MTHTGARDPKAVARQLCVRVVGAQAMAKNFTNGDRVLQIAVNPSGYE